MPHPINFAVVELARLSLHGPSSAELIKALIRQVWTMMLTQQEGGIRAAILTPIRAKTMMVALTNLYYLAY